MITAFTTAGGVRSTTVLKKPSEKKEIPALYIILKKTRTSLKT